MLVHQETLRVTTRGYGDMHDMTAELQSAVAASRIQTGMAHIFNVGSTAAIVSIEFEPGLQADLPAVLSRLVPPSQSYGHEQAWHDGNGHSHLQASWLGPDLNVPIRGGSLRLGTWQQIVHVECDVRPRQREVVVTLMGDA